MKCQVIGCENEAKYWDTFSGHCGDTREVKVAVCEEHLISGWSLPQDEKAREEAIKRVLGDAEKIL